MLLAPGLKAIAEKRAASAPETLEETQAVEQFVQQVTQRPRRSRAEHGTTARYGLGCRCTTCRAVHAERMRRCRERCFK